MSGGTKHDQGKLQIGLISVIFLRGLASILTFGAKKYAAHNWRQGLLYSRCYDALCRHLFAWWGGEENDPETGESHLDHAACCLMFLRELSETRPDLDDRYKESQDGTETRDRVSDGESSPLPEEAEKHSRVFDPAVEYHR